MSQQCPLFARPGAAVRVLLPPSESKVGTLRGCVTSSPTGASHVAAVSPLCAPRRSRSCSFFFVRKQSGDIAGLRHDISNRRITCRSGVPSLRAQAQPFVFFSPRPKAKWGHCGVASRHLQPAHHMSQQCPLFAFPRRSRPCSSSPAASSPPLIKPALPAHASAQPQAA